jgi:siroheme synthase
MGAGQAEAITAALLERGMAPATPVAIVENASLPNAHCVMARLKELPQAVAQEAGAPALILVGAALAAATQALPGVAVLHAAA